VCQLKETIGTLRAETERLNNKAIDDVQKVASSNLNEINHYRNMIRSLRDEIDRKQVSDDKNLQKATQKKDMEFKELHETIIELRSKLDHDHAN